MANKEATARIKINKLLEAAGWRFFPEGSAPANIRLEPSVTIKSSDLEALGENFEKTSKGFIDFLLLDAKGFPLIVLEAKSEDKNPLVGKEQARKYAKSQNCRFVILSNGNLHYFWDLERGNPYLITSFPTPDSVTGYQQVTPNPQRLIEDQVGDDYIVLTQRPNYQSEAAWRNEAERPGYIEANKLRFLRPYQLKAIHALQQAVKEGKDRFLFEMATGTGKTLTAAAVIKLFLRTGNARRVLFLVDRLELEDQAEESLHQRYCQATISRRSSTRRTATTGAGRRSSSPRCSRCSSTTSTSASSRRPISTWSSPTKRTAPSAATPAPCSSTSSATSSA